MKKFPIVAMLAAAAIVLTACSSGGATDSSSTSSAPTDLKIGNFLDVTSWDPANADIGFDGPYLSAVYDPLIALDTDSQPIPALATDWSYSADFLTLTMHLRTGVTFSDGTAFDASVAVANLEHLKAGTLSGPTYANVASFQATDPTTLTITLTQRDDTLLYLMGLGRSYMVSPKALTSSTLATTPVGSGPYVLDASTSTAGSDYHFTKVDGYWDASTYPFANLEIMPITDATARNNAMLSGQINVNYAAATDLPQAQQNSWNVSQKVAGWVGLQFIDHTGSMLAPLGNEKVRQALNYAFDGASILQSIGSGAGVATNQVFPDGGAINDSSLNSTYAYNVATAKQLLSDAGYASGFSVTMPMSPVFQQWQAVTQQSLADIGVTVTWDDMSQADYQTKAATYPMFVSYLAMDSNPNATVAQMLTTPQWFDPTPEYTQFPELVSLVDQINQATGDAQTALIKQLNTQLTQMAWWSVWYQANNIYVSSPGITVTPITGMMFPTLRYIQQG
ncbi:ABC transporter substrate-binding protein [Subtercola sp. YIM 133946]|uniref:ABC transporter substrate-binding protein n=1 Tax=Subtercola sp. YIM 133946 TaxID=3118909 RepID=UPI002F91DB4A